MEMCRNCSNCGGERDVKDIEDREDECYSCRYACVEPLCHRGARRESENGERCAHHELEEWRRAEPEYVVGDMATITREIGFWENEVRYEAR